MAAGANFRCDEARGITEVVMQIIMFFPLYFMPNGFKTQSDVVIVSAIRMFYEIH